MTAQDLCIQALQHIGVVSQGETPAAAELAQALTQLNQIISSWSLEGETVYTSKVEQFNAFSGSQFTIGPGGTWATVARPVQVTGARAISGQFSKPLTVLPMAVFESQAGNDMGATVALPALMGVDNAAPLRNVRLHPPLNAPAVIEVTSWQPLTQFAALSDTVSFPVQGYELALALDLAVTLAPSFGRPVSQELAVNLERAKSRIRAANGFAPPVAPPVAAPVQ